MLASESHSIELPRHGVGRVEGSGDHHTAGPLPPHAKEVGVGGVTLAFHNLGACARMLCVHLDRDLGYRLEGATYRTRRRSRATNASHGRLQTQTTDFTVRPPWHQQKLPPFVGAPKSNASSKGSTNGERRILKGITGVCRCVSCLWIES